MLFESYLGGLVAHVESSHRSRVSPLFVCMSFFPNNISKTMQLGSPNLTCKMFHSESCEPFWGSKGQRSRMGLRTPVISGFFSLTVSLTANYDKIFTRAMLPSADTSYCHVSVCLSVCLSHAGIVSKRLNVGSRKQRHAIAQKLT